MEGQGACGRQRSCGVQTRKRSNASKSRLRSGGALRLVLATASNEGPSGTGGQRHGGNGHGDVVRLQSRMPSGGKEVRREEGCRSSCRGLACQAEDQESCSRNATNPMTGSGMQQARDLRAEEPVEVVRNHADGTGFRGWFLGTEARGDACGSGRSVATTRDALARSGVGGGEVGARTGLRRKSRFRNAPPDESHERRSRVRPGQQ